MLQRWCEALCDQKYRWICEEVDRPSKTELPQDGLEFQPTFSCRRLDSPQEPGVKQQPQKHEEPPRGAFVLMVFVRGIILDFAEAYQHHVDDPHHKTRRDHQIQLANPRLQQGVP